MSCSESLAVVSEGCLCKIWQKLPHGKGLHRIEVLISSPASQLHWEALVTALKTKPA